MKFIDYIKVHKDFVRWRNEKLPMKESTLCIGGQHFEKGLVIDINPKYADIVADAHNLPFGDKTFEDCQIFQVLEHVTNPLRVLDEINRVITNDLYVSVPTAKKFKFTYFNEPDNEHNHRWEMPDEYWKRLFGVAGFKICYKDRFYPYPQYRWWPSDKIGGLHKSFSFWKLTSEW